MRTHPDHVVAAALAAYDCIGTKNHRAIARAAQAVNVPLPTVIDWIKGKRYISPDIMEARSAKKQELTERLDEIAHRILDHIPAKLDTAPLNQCAVALGIAIDKRQLLLGQATSIQAGVFLTTQQREEKLSQIFAKRMIGKPQDVVVEAEKAESDDLSDRK